MLNKRTINFNKTASKLIFLKSKMKKPVNVKLRKINLKDVRLAKKDIQHLKLIGQFQNKFLVAMDMHTKRIIIFDQHAVHERILYEYYSEILNKEKFDLINLTENIIRNNSFKNVFSKQILDIPIFLSLQDIILPRVISRNNSLFSIFNFDFILLNGENERNNSNKVKIISVPIIFDRLLKENVYINIFKSLIKNFEKESSNDVLFFETFNESVKSRACKDAIKFNEVLELNVMESLISSLKDCNIPFLCAHGRHNFFIIGKKVNLSNNNNNN